MTVEKNRLLYLITAVANGDPVDWKREIAASYDDEERSLLRSLELVAILANLHRDAPGGPTFAAGQRVGLLEIVERIGVGTRGEVYLAHDTRLERKVALKILKPHSDEAESNSNKRLLEEARRLASVRHPNVVAVYAAEVVDGSNSISLEFVRGKTLALIMRERGRFGPQEIATIGLDLCRALAAVHGAGLVHQDVKAENIMREEGGRIVLMDFGARSATPLYMAPEVLRGEQATVRSDLYSLGVLLYNLATCSFPILASRYEDLLRAHGERLAIPLRDARADLPAPLVHVIETALAPDPSARYESAGMMERALAASLGLRPNQENALCETQPVRPDGRTLLGLGKRRTTLAGVIALAALAALAAVSVAWWRLHLARLRSPMRAVEIGDVMPRPQTTVPRGAEGALSFTVEATFYRGEAKAVPLAEGSRIAIGDSLSLHLRGSDSLYVYVVDEDDRGEAYLLFPLPNTELRNPVSPNITHVLPGALGDEQLYWQVTTAGGHERFLVVASSERLARFEDRLFALERASAKNGLQYVHLNESAKDELRGVGAIVHGPRHSASVSATPQGRSRKNLEPLASQPESARGVWVRTIEFLNPG